MAIPPQRMERQLTHLVERGYRGVTFGQAVSGVSRGKTLAVTFDDGFRSVLEQGLPILSRLGLPGTVFVPSALVGGPGAMAWPGTDRWLGTPHEDGLRSLTWDELGSLANAGWEIGSHTRTHPWLTGLDDHELKAELRGSREDCEERLGTACSSLSYPFGDVDARVVRAAAAAGYRAAATLPMRLHRRRALEWPRVGIYNNDPFPRFRAKVSRLRRYLIGSGAGEAVVRASTRFARD
jgi:peptidoglycan/xylan/chitin deacetylase (PgdA/CDA1 family)